MDVKRNVVDLPYQIQYAMPIKYFRVGIWRRHLQITIRADVLPRKQYPYGEPPRLFRLSQLEWVFLTRHPFCNIGDWAAVVDVDKSLVRNLKGGSLPYICYFCFWQSSLADDPSAFLLQHLAVYGINTVLGGFRLVLCDAQLSTHTASVGSRIGFCLLKLSTEDPTLRAGLSELKQNGNTSESSDSDSPPHSSNRLAFSYAQALFDSFYGLCYLIFGLISSRLAAGLLWEYDRWDRWWDGRMYWRWLNDGLRVFGSVLLTILTGFFFFHGLLEMHFLN